MAWIDNLRAFVIVLVVNVHACVTYSHVGSWYVNEPPEPPMQVKIWFLFWQGHLQSFFMGLLFFLAGTFAHQSLQRRGPLPFLRERAIRLGLPALLYMLVIHPLIVFVILKRNSTATLADNYLSYVLSGRFLSGNGPLWFALALLVFSACYASWRSLTGTEGNATEKSVPSLLTLGIVGLVLVFATFLTRIFQPIGTNILNFQLCFFPQYIAAFAAGIAAAKYQWLERLALSSQARWAGLFGLFIGPILLLAVLKFGGPLPERGPNPFAGGWHPQAFGLAFWEQLTGLALGVGLLAVFRRRMNRSNAFTDWLSDRAFAVYVLHAPILVVLTLGLRHVAGGPITKALLLTLLGLVASYVATDIAKRVPGLRRIL